MSRSCGHRLLVVATSALLSLCGNVLAEQCHSGAKQVIMPSLRTVQDTEGTSTLELRRGGSAHIGGSAVILEAPQELARQEPGAVCVDWADGTFGTGAGGVTNAELTSRGWSTDCDRFRDGADFLSFWKSGGRKCSISQKLPSGPSGEGSPYVEVTWGNAFTGGSKRPTHYSELFIGTAASTVVSYKASARGGGSMGQSPDLITTLVPYTEEVDSIYFVVGNSYPGTSYNQASIGSAKSIKLCRGVLPPAPSPALDEEGCVDWFKVGNNSAAGETFGSPFAMTQSGWKFSSCKTASVEEPAGAFTFWGDECVLESPVHPGGGSFAIVTWGSANVDTGSVEVHIDTPGNPEHDPASDSAPATAEKLGTKMPFTSGQSVRVKSVGRARAAIYGIRICQS